MKALILTLVLGLASSSHADDSKLSREQIHEAFETCVTENNLTRPEPGQRPSDADRATLEACLKTKGVTHMPHHPHDRQ